MPASDETIYSVPENKRLALDLSKNIIIHFFVPAGLVACSMLAPPGPPVSRAVLAERCHFLSRLFRYEFMFRADIPFETVFHDTLNQMIARHELKETNDAILFGDGRDGLSGRGWVVLYASMLRNFLEAYRVAARSIALLVRGPMTQKDLVRRALATGDRMYLAGELERREALSRPCMENALQSFLDAGYLRSEGEKEKKYGLSSSFEDAEAVGTIEARIAAFLSRRADDK